MHIDALKHTEPPAAPHSINVQAFIHRSLLDAVVTRVDKAASPNGMGFWEREMHINYRRLNILEDASLGRKLKQLRE